MCEKAIYLMAALLLAGCASTSKETVSLAETLPDSSPDGDSPVITQIDYEEPISSKIVQPAPLHVIPKNDEEIFHSQQAPLANELTLDSLEQMALINNPSIAQAAARVDALNGKWVQVGLPPNPTLGYVAGEIGNDNKAGQQGAFVGQDFISGGKLQRNRDVVSSEISIAEQQLASVERKVRTDVRKGYYGVLLAQRRVELANDLVRVTTEAANASKSLVDAQEIPLAGLLQTEIQQQNAQVLLRTSNNNLQQAWRWLSAVVSQPLSPSQKLLGDVSQIPEALDWQVQFTRLRGESPELAAAISEIERSRRALDRAYVEAAPDISTQVSVQYDNSTENTITGVQVGLPLPLWNRNQGGIYQAQAEVTEAERNIDRVERDLEQRLASVFRQYSDAHATANGYLNDILPRAKRTFELVQRGYSQGELGYLDLLAAQQTYSQTNLAYLDALGTLWQSYTRIEGLLLDESLAQWY